MTEVRHFVDPEPVRTKLKDTTVRFLFNQRERKRVAIKRDRLLVSVRRTFDRDIGATGKLRSFQFGHQILDLSLPFPASKSARAVLQRRSSPFPIPSPR